MKTKHTHEMKRSRKFWIKGTLTVLLAAIVGMAAFSGCTAKGGEEKIRTFKIDTAYGKMEFPEKFKENLKHEEIIEGDVTSEVFSMVSGEMEREFCRLVFGDAAQSELIGYYDQTPVALVIYNYAGAEFPDAETEELYFSMMDNVNMLIDSLKNGGNFQAGAAPGLGDNAAAKMKYWQIDIPDAIEWEEVTEGDTYKLTFYGTVGQTRIELYAICLGDSDTQEILGVFTADGEKKSLWVEYASMDQLEGFSEDDLAAAYAMFDTINDIMPQITQNKNFSDQLAEEPAA